MPKKNAMNGSGPGLRSPQERKQILRKVITRAQSLTDRINEKTIQNLELCMEETDCINLETSIDEKIHNQEEVLMDSEMMSISSNVLSCCTRSLTRGLRVYNPDEFAQKIVAYTQRLPDTETETPQWSLLEAQVAKCFKRTPNYSTLLGTLAPLEKKETAKRKATVREAQAAIKKPNNIIAADKEEEGPEQTVQMREFIKRYWKAYRKPIDFFQLVVHPTDFQKTVENVLQVSFLARDGNIKLSMDSEKLVLKPCSKDMAAQAKKAGNNVTVQNVISVTMKQWEVTLFLFRHIVGGDFKFMRLFFQFLRRVYRLKKPMIESGIPT